MLNTESNFSQIKPIETIYKGYRFRSRLEARWATFFDMMGLNWQYEVEGYDLGEKGYYLPDFFITSPQGYNFYYETKPRGYINDGKLDLLIKLLEANNNYENGNCVVISGSTLIGDPIDVTTQNYPTICPRCGVIRPLGFEYGGDKYNDITSCGCQLCDFKEGNGHYTAKEDLCLFNHEYHKGWIQVSGIDNRIYSTQISNAARAARQARFEHGESP